MTEHVRVAVIGGGIKAVNNGPICYAPDGSPLLGPVEGHEGLWLAAGFAVGIGTGSLDSSRTQGFTGTPETQ